MLNQETGNQEPLSTSDLILSAMQKAEGTGSQEEEIEEEGSQESQASESETTEVQQPEEEQDVEEIAITDDTGRKKIKVNFKDRESIKKAYSMAAASRKWKLDKDRAESKVKEIEPKYQELSTLWNSVESVYKSDGVAGLVNLIEGKPEAYEEFKKKLVEEQDFLRNASPEQLDKWEFEARAKKAEQEVERLRNEVKAQVEKMQKEKEDSEMSNLNSKLVPSFNKYRLKGKLGDTELEARFDKAIWREVMDNLSAYPETVDISAHIEAEFKKVSQLYSKGYQKAVQGKVSSVVKDKKVKAAQSMASTVNKAQKSSTEDEKVLNDLRGGNLKGAFSSLFSRGFKL
jgi:hypothetical protein